MSNDLPIPHQTNGAPAGVPAVAASIPRAFNPPPPGAHGSVGPGLKRYVAALLRYKWLIAVMSILGAAAGTAATRFLPPRYTAQATIWISKAERLGDSDRGPIRPSQLLESDGWVDLLKSYAVLDDAVETLRLYLRPGAAGDFPLFDGFELAERFRPGAYALRVGHDRAMTLVTSEGTLVERAAVGDSIGGRVGLLWAPPADQLTPGRAVVFTLTRPRDAARNLAQSLSVRTARDGNFLGIELAGINPEKIAATVNAVVQRYVAVAAELKREKATELARVLNDQLGNAEESLRSAEIALESFRVETITLPSESQSPIAAGLEITRDPVFDNFFEMKLEQEQLRRDREAIDAALSAVGETGLAAAALEVIPAVQRSKQLVDAAGDLIEKQAELRALRARYTDEHQAVRRLDAEIRALETEAIPGLARALIADITTREAVLSARVNSATRELQQIPPRVIQEARLRRAVSIQEDLYTTLRARFEEAQLAEASAVPDVSILDEAVVPTNPDRNQAPALILLGLFGGLGCAVAMSVVLDRLDKRVRYPEQVTSDMGLMILGVVPHMKTPRNGRGDDGTSGAVIEALRGTRLNLVHAWGAAGPLLVTVTSPGTGDGKSFVAANLAVSFVEAGYRTLLIDGDARRGTLHRAMDVDRKPGLTDLLEGRAALADVTHETGSPALSFIPCGTRAATAPELVGSPAMRDLVNSLRSTYSVILIDSPPLGAGVDAFAMGTITGNMVVVLRTGITDRQLAEAKLDVLDRLPVRVLGAVLNGVRESGVYQYYSYQLSGYEMRPEDAAATGRLLGKVRG
ncbi:MAG TPA: polysaccharide biosynthesis tyrosine autokinase [Gemmatimonadales bacterium]